MKFPIFLTAIIAFGAVPALAQQNRGTADGTTRAEAQAQVARMFANTDTNRDGFVTLAEASAQKQARPARGADRARPRGDRFAAIDADGNGSISRAEFEARFAMGRGDRAERRRDRAERRANRLELRANRGLGMNPRRFERLDANGDGRLSLAEAGARRLARFAAADVDSNGIVTRDERRAARDKMQAARQQRRGS